MFTALIESDLFGYAILPLLIFFTRILDVSLGTLRIIFVSKGNKRIAPLLGFVEVFIWILAISRIMQNLDNPLNYFAYAAGFATGNYIGMLIEEKLALGVMNIRIITQQNADVLIHQLQEHGFGTTSVNAKGRMENVHIIYTIVQRTNINKVIKLIQEYNPHAFYSIEDIRFVSKELFPLKSVDVPRSKVFPFKRTRKEK